jgi:hypothetical protein
MPWSQSVSTKANIQLALRALKQDATSSLQRAGAPYSVTETTLQRRRDGIASQRDKPPNSIVLTLAEEQAIVQHILDLDTRGFPPRLAAVKDMADSLLDERGWRPVGCNLFKTYSRAQSQVQSEVRL